MYLLTGRAGSGKSTVCLALKQHDWPAFDADAVPGLASWIDLKTGQPTVVDHTKYVDYTKVGWNWDQAAFEDFMAAQPANALLCGSASNQLRYHAKFRKVFVLTLNADTHRQRLQTRQNSDYAKNPRQIQEILAEQQILVTEAVRLGAVPINAAQPVELIVKDIVGLLA